MVYEIDDSHCIDMKTLRILKKFLIGTTYEKLSLICPKFLLELSPVIKILKIEEWTVDGESCDAVSSENLSVERKHSGI